MVSSLSLASAAAAAALFLAAVPQAFAASSDSTLVNQCRSAKYTFNADRTFTRSGSATIFDSSVDNSAYDFTIDYSSSNVAFQDKSLVLTLSPPKSGKIGEGVRVSHTRPVLYGRISASITAPAASFGGVVTTFITMSDVKDEIDWEIVGQSATTAQSNIFYRGIEEVGIHGGTHALGGATSATHVYTIDWKPDVLTWSVDGKVVRTERRSESQRDSELTRAKFPDGPVQWYPNTPSIIQFSVWDGGDQPSAGTATWAGGPVNFGIGAIKAKYDYLEVQCYDDQGNAVSAVSGAKPFGAAGGSNNATAISVGSTEGAGTAGTVNADAGTSDPLKPSGLSSAALPRPAGRWAPGAAMAAAAMAALTAFFV